MYSELSNLIKKSNKIVLASHVEPDGDAIGSSLAFYIALKNLGKNVKIYNSSKTISNSYDFLPYFSKITDIFPQNCDLLISFDCGSFKRLGIEKGSYKVVNIDHHQSNELFGDLNIVQPSHPSTSSVVYKILQNMDIKISKDIALCIYTALAEDTNFFSDSTTNKEAFELAKNLVEYGADAALVGKNLKNRKSLAFLRLQAMFIDTILLKKDAQIAIGGIDEKMLKKSGALRYDAAHLADILQSLATVKLSIFTMQMPNNIVKFSLRSDNIDVSKIATKYGGGGHKMSAGFSIDEDKKDLVIQEIVNGVNL